MELHGIMDLIIGVLYSGNLTNIKLCPMIVTALTSSAMIAVFLTARWRDGMVWSHLVRQEVLPLLILLNFDQII